MRYEKECRAHLTANGKVKPKEKDTVSYQSGNDLIIRPAKFTDNTAVLSVINLLVGSCHRYRCGMFPDRTGNPEKCKF